MKEKTLTTNNFQSYIEQSELWNVYPNVVTALEKQSDQNPTKIALVDGDDKITYQELNQQANQLAAYLQKQNIQAGSIVGVCVAQSARRIISFLAVLKTGAAYLPIDGDLPQARINFMIEDARLDFFLSEEIYLDKIDNQTTRSVSLDLLHYNADCNALSKENINVNFDPASTSYVIYTSGSTGVPKGVMIGHRSFFHFVTHQAEILGIDYNSKTLQFASPSFDAAVIDIWVPLVQGATVYLYPNNKVVGEPLLDYIVAHHIDTVPLMPPMVLASLPTNKSIGRLRTMGVGGEACTESTVMAWYRKIRLINSYGPTEATVAITNYEFKEESNPRIIGKAVPYALLFVLDEDLMPVGTSVAGELYVGGLPLALRYLNRPEDTKKSFIDAPEWLHEQLGEYRTKSNSSSY